jgi:hypothetical protein
MNLKESLENFVDADYGRVTRNDQAYQDTIALTVSELDRLVSMYRWGGNMQHLRLLRDSIDHWIRRYHGYTIGGSIGTHYREQGIVGKGIFEHVIPASKLRDMLIKGTLSVQQALNAPICRINAGSDLALRESGLVSTNNDYWYFFRRYAGLTNCVIETHDGTVINAKTWTLEKHYAYFKDLV